MDVTPAEGKGFPLETARGHDLLLGFVGVVGVGDDEAVEAPFVLEDVGLGLLVAGHETTAVTLTWTLFLLSDRARFITGSYHLVDGGYTAA